MAIWAFLLGVGWVGPITLVLAQLGLPSFELGPAARQARFLSYVLHPGALFLKAVIVMPLVEEIFYRGLVLQLFRRYLPTWSAALISTAFFAATHLSPGLNNALNAFALGFLFVWLVLRTGSLLPAILCHAAFNFSFLFLVGPAFGLTAQALDPAASPASTSPYPGWWVGLSLSVIVAATVMLAKFSPQRSPDGSAAA